MRKNERQCDIDFSNHIMLMKRSEEVLKYTSNFSSKVLALFYKSKKIKNWFHPLLLYDDKLMKVDPFREDLTPNLKSRILIEIKRNPYYFFREILRITEVGGVIPFRMHRGNNPVIWLSLHDQYSLLILARQRGKTTVSMGILLYIFLFGTINDNITVSHKDSNGAMQLLSRYRSMFAELPKWVREIFDYNPEIDTTNDNIDNKNTIKCAVSKNIIETLISNSSPETAERNGRGRTTASLFLDELAFIPQLPLFLKGLGPAQSKARQSALKNLMPSIWLATTTPGDKDRGPGAYVYERMKKGVRFKESMFDKTVHGLNKLQENTSQIFWVQFDFFQTGGTREEFNTIANKDLNGDMKSIKQELSLEWPSASASSLFEESTIESLKSRAMPPIKALSINELLAKEKMELLKKDISLYLYKDVEDTHPLLITLDTAEGDGGDSHSIHIIDAETGDEVGLLTSNEISIFDVLRILVYLLIKRYTVSILVAELNLHGKTVVKYLLHELSNSLDINFEERIFDHKKTDPTVSVIRKNIQITKTSNDIMYGIQTTAQSRPVILESLIQTVHYKPNVFRSKTLINQISGLIRNNSGRVDHAPGDHDDSVISFALGMYVLQHKSADVKRKLRPLMEDQLTRKVDFNERKEALKSFRGFDAELNKEQLNKYDDTKLEKVNEYLSDRRNHLLKSIDEEDDKSLSDAVSFFNSDIFNPAIRDDVDKFSESDSLFL